MSGPLRIAIDLRPLALDAVTGIGLVVALILEEMTVRGVSFIGVSDRALPEGRIPPTVPVLVGGAPGKRIRWESSVLGDLLRRIAPAPDLYHAAWNHGLPRGLPFPSVLSIYDLIPWRFPQDVPWPKPAFLHRALYKDAVRRSARAAAAIVTGSDVSRRDIVERLPEVAERIEVIPNAIPRWFRPAGAAEGAALRERLTAGRPYWLYLGGFEHRKSIPMLLEAMAEAFPDPGAAPELLLAGAMNDYARTCESLALDLGLRARFPGYVADRDLPALFAGASLFLYPSRYEGFGLPLLFAMASGVPSIVSDGGSLPEVVGDAALLFPSGDRRALAAILSRAAADPASMAPYQAKGRERAARFSAETFAARMIQVYARAAARRGEYA